MKLVSMIVAISMFFSQSVFSDCDFSKVEDNKDGTYTYYKELHICVGQLVQDNATKTKQVADLTKAITLKDLAIQASDQRTQLWMDTTFKLEDNIQKIDSYQKRNDWLYFALGALTIIGTGFALSAVTNRH